MIVALACAQMMADSSRSDFDRVLAAREQHLLNYPASSVFMCASSGTKSLRGSKRYCRSLRPKSSVRFRADVAWSRRFSEKFVHFVLRAITGRMPELERSV